MRKDCRVSEYRLQRSLDRRDLQETLASRDKAEACMDPALPPGLMVGAKTWFRDSQTVAKAPYCKARIWTGPWLVVKRTAKFHWAIAPVHFKGIRVQVIAYVDDLLIFTSPDEDRFTGLGRPQLDTEAEHQTEDKTIGFYSRRPAPGAFNDIKLPAGPSSTTDQQTEENYMEEGGLSAPKTQISIVAHPQKWGLESVVFSKPDRNAFSHEKVCFDVPKLVGQTSVSHPLPTNLKTMGGQNLSRGLSSEVAGSRGSKLDKSEEWKDQVKFVGFGDSTPKANAGGAPLPSPSVGHSNRTAGKTSGEDHSPSSAGGIPSFPQSVNDMAEFLTQVLPEVSAKIAGDQEQGEECRQMGAQKMYQPPGQNRTLSLQLGEWAYFGVTREGKPAEDDVTFKCPQHHLVLKPRRGTITQLQVAANLEKKLRNYTHKLRMINLKF